MRLIQSRKPGLHRLLLVIILAATPTAHAQWTITGQAVPELAAFDAAMQDLMTTRDIPSGALAITWQGRLVYARGFSWNPGPDDIVTQPTSLFRIASVSKPLTSTLVNRLIQDGELSLDATAAQYVDLTPLPGRSNDPRLSSVTVRDLLEHLGGFGSPQQLGYDPVFNDETVDAQTGSGLPVGQDDIVRYQSGVPLFSGPGSTYGYSNYGYLLLGKIIEAVTGMSYEAYAHSVLNRIGIWHLQQARSARALRYAGEVAYRSGGSKTSVIDESGALLPYEYGGLNYENMDAFGGWVGSAPELVRWLANLDDPDAPGALLDAASLDRMFALPQNYPGPYNPGDYFYASGWQVRDYGSGGRNTWHDGSLPSTTAYAVRLRTGFDFVALLNRRNDQGGPHYSGLVDAAILGAYQTIDAWPAHDLFRQTLTTVFIADFE